MELPPSYEEATKQPNAFGGRIGVFNKYYQLLFMPVLLLPTIVN